MKDPRARRSVEDIAAALEGDYRVEHLFVLKQELNLYDIYQQQIQECDQQVEQCLSQFASQSDEPLPPRPKGKSRVVMRLHLTCGLIFTAFLA